MTSRMSRCSRHDSPAASAFARLTPLTSARRIGSSSSIFAVSAPNFSIILRAVAGPMPRMRPEPRNFSRPSAVDGSALSQLSKWNCIP